MELEYVLIFICGLYVGMPFGILLAVAKARRDKQ